MDPEAEAFSAVAVAFRKDAEDLQFADGVFYRNPLGGEPSVGGFLLWGEGLILTAPVGYFAFCVRPVDSFVAEVGPQGYLGVQADTAPSQQLEVVYAALTGGHTERILPPQVISWIFWVWRCFLPE